MTSPLLEVDELSVVFRGRRGAAPVHASDRVSLAVAAGETVGLVGESGSGKSTIGRAVLGLVPVTSGRIRFAEHDITEAGRRERRRLSAELQVVFQDPYSSLNPTRTVGQTLIEPLLVHESLRRSEIEKRVATALERVGLPTDAAGRYPSQFSGGQRQRIAIARALMTEPRLIVCDEPLSALDLSVQAQVLNLLSDLQREHGFSYLFISHDLPLVRYLCDTVIVLYQGQIMERGAAPQVFASPTHPYTRMLIDTVPDPDPRIQRTRPHTVRPAEAEGTATGCPFAARCSFATDICRAERPALRAIDLDGTQTVDVACHHAEEIRRRHGQPLKMPAGDTPPPPR